MHKNLQVYCSIVYFLLLALLCKLETLCARMLWYLFDSPIMRKIKSVDMQVSSLLFLVGTTVHKVKVFGFV